MSYCNGNCKYLNPKKHKCELTGDKKLDIAYENVGNALDRVIEIVKRGGVD